MIRAFVRWMEVDRSVRFWRWTLLLYGVALTIGTHWPGMRIGQPSGFPTDKILHVVAFTGLAGFVMLARPTGSDAGRAFHCRNIGWSTLIAVIWAGLDEVTQIFGEVDRFATVQDFVANLIGVSLAAFVALFVFARVPISSSKAPSSVAGRSDG
ncbi:MAG: VanZ family protein [Phycisphaerales bacterium]